MQILDWADCVHQDLLGEHTWPRWMGFMVKIKVLPSIGFKATTGGPEAPQLEKIQKKKKKNGA